MPFYVAAGENAWAGVKAHLDTVTERAAVPIIAKYTGVLAAADSPGPGCGSANWSRAGVAPDRRITAARIVFLLWIIR